jgi:hypothetical protein
MGSTGASILKILRNASAPLGPNHRRRAIVGNGLLQRTYASKLDNSVEASQAAPDQMPKGVKGSGTSNWGQGSQGSQRRRGRGQRNQNQTSKNTTNPLSSAQLTGGRGTGTRGRGRATSADHIFNQLDRSDDLKCTNAAHAGGTNPTPAAY